MSRFLVEGYLWKNEEKDGHEDGWCGRANGDERIAKSFHFESVPPPRHEDWRLQFLLKICAILLFIVAYLEEPQCNQDDKENKDLNIVRR